MRSSKLYFGNNKLKHYVKNFYSGSIVLAYLLNRYINVFAITYLMSSFFVLVNFTEPDTSLYEFSSFIGSGNFIWITSIAALFAWGFAIVISQNLRIETIQCKELCENSEGKNS